jgi:uncharacterized membrane-anchored protein
MTHALTSLLASKDHPLRSALVEEMHVRRLPAFAAPMRMAQLVMFTGEESTTEARRAVDDLCRRYGVTPPSKGRYFRADLKGMQLVWEHHTECCTYTFIKAGAFEDPFANPVLAEIPIDWSLQLPGRVLRATQVAVLPRGAEAPLASELTRWFAAGEVMSCCVSGGEARIWSDFRVHSDGLGRLLVLDQDLKSTGDTARLVQRLQELGNYRNLALLGLPVAQSYSTTLSALEKRLTEVTRQIAAQHGTDESLLEDLSTLSAELARVTAETSYRISATRAYAQLVFDRLRSLEVRREPGYQTLIDFTERRLTPAVRTCESFQRRLDDLAQRASWTSSLLRTRVETKLERQNTALLESMNRGTLMQVRLQQTVEGLSVLAITYYSIGVLGYALKPLGHIYPTLDIAVLLGGLAPIVLAVVWCLMHRLRRRYVRAGEKEP